MSKFSFYHQHDFMQCGITCLQMVCKYYEKEYSPDTLSRYCFATTEGVSLPGISEAATRPGLHTTCGRVTIEQLYEAPLPCILHWNQNHFVVLYRIKKKIFYVADPGKGLVTYTEQEMKEHWLSTQSRGEEKEIAMFLQTTPAIHGQMTLGMMPAVQYIIGQLNSPVEQLMNFFYSLQDVKISLERINEIHEMKNEESEKGLFNEYHDVNKDIHFSHVDFKYDPHSPRKTIDGVSFTIPECKVTAIVGASGSGKTTLLKLMLGYYPVASGEIRIAVTNLNRYSMKWWRRECGVVMQDGVIFSESIARNIAVDDGEINREKLLQAVEIANIKDFIMSLPMRFNTKIGRDGIGLSQGQKQRILIARAVYKNPKYIFLDEATNAPDAKNERAIVENPDQYYKGRTVVVVAHRLSTVRNAHQIIVPDKGKVVETGNHAGCSSHSLSSEQRYERYCFYPSFR